MRCFSHSCTVTVQRGGAREDAPVFIWCRTACHNQTCMMTSVSLAHGPFCLLRHFKCAILQWGLWPLVRALASWMARLINPTAVAGRCRRLGPEATSRAALADGCNKAAEKEGSLTSFVLCVAFFRKPMETPIGFGLRMSTRLLNSLEQSEHSYRHRTCSLSRYTPRLPCVEPAWDV